MFNEVVKLTPQVDRAALAGMFKSLNQRFAAVARKFGDGLKNAMRMGPMFAIAGAFLAKLLNPLQKAEEIMDRVLNKGSDAIDAAEELQTDPGKLLRLQALGEAKGVDAETMRNLLGRFQAALAQEQEKVAAPERLAKQLAAETDPERREIIMSQLKAAESARDQGGTLREFVDEKDTVDGFFKFMQSLNQIQDKSRRVVIQREIFGERARGRTAQLFNTEAPELAAILKELPTAQALGQAARRADSVADKRDRLAAVRNAQDFVSKPGQINESQVQAIDQSKRNELAAEDETLARFDELKATNIAVQELTHKFDKLATQIVNDFAPKLVTGINDITAFINDNMPYFREKITEAEIAFNKLTETVKGIKTSLEQTWTEFKTSKFFQYGIRIFGGGN